MSGLSCRRTSVRAAERERVHKLPDHHLRIRTVFVLSAAVVN